MTLQRSRETPLNLPTNFPNTQKNYDALSHQGPSRGTAGRINVSLAHQAISRSENFNEAAIIIRLINR